MGSKVPIVALTAHAMLGDRQRFLDAGMDDYLAKPIEEAELVRVLSRWLALRSAPESAEAGPASLPEIAGMDVRGALQRVAGKADLLWRLVDDFRQRHTQAGAQMRAALAADSRAPAAHLAHTLKGGAATLGLRRVAAAAAALETALHAGPVAPELLDELDAALGEIGAATLPMAEPPRQPAPGNGAPHSAQAWQELASALASNSISARAKFKVLLDGASVELQSSLAEVGKHIDALRFAPAAALLAELSGKQPRPDEAGSYRGDCDDQQPGSTRTAHPDR